MKYNLYKSTVTENSIDFKKSKVFSESLSQLLYNIQEEIIILYEEKQFKNHGIKSLGNEMRYSENLNRYLENSELEFYIIKFTENKRSFLGKFLDTTLKVKESQIYFLIFGDEFGKESKLVDNSFIRIEQVKKDLITFFDMYKPRILLPEISFIEITSFTGCFFEDRRGYNFIHKI
jgi:hypothetical protein